MSQIELPIAAAVSRTTPNDQLDQTDRSKTGTIISKQSYSVFLCFGFSLTGIDGQIKLVVCCVVGVFMLAL